MIRKVPPSMLLVQNRVGEPRPVSNGRGPERGEYACGDRLRSIVAERGGDCGYETCWTGEGLIAPGLSPGDGRPKVGLGC